MYTYKINVVKHVKYCCFFLYIYHMLKNFIKDFSFDHYVL